MDRVIEVVVGRQWGRWQARAEGLFPGRGRTIEGAVRNVVAWNRVGGGARVEWRVELPDSVASRVAEHERRREELARAREAAERATRDAIDGLTAEGIGIRDIARILGMSATRAHVERNSPSADGARQAGAEEGCEDPPRGDAESLS